MSEFLYIYNIQQSNFYIEKGCTPVATGINPKTTKIWFKFARNDTQKAYEEWCKKCEDLK